jgi:hypothetical protein
VIASTASEHLYGSTATNDGDSAVVIICGCLVIVGWLARQVVADGAETLVTVGTSRASLRIPRCRQNLNRNISEIYR